MSLKNLAFKTISSKFEPGRIYSLGEIAPFTSRFKSKTFLSCKEGMFHLYRNQVDKGYWIGGPFQGEDSNLFLFLGYPKSESEMKKLIDSLRPQKKNNRASSSESYYHDYARLHGHDWGFYSFIDYLAYDFSGLGSDFYW